ncbi:hypothetical protein SAMN04488090_1990 [Siphonobacter aquaeclarae]|uniref:Uncharacterized protein n=1 Tax=Siphonobacter aquaeclarae TaxID=563176 RepID=A0A1G9NH35_9BACT|nr:hypothetical protein SAMN04488090_1990 [Siphonobacter aquaeclarae]
MKKKDPGHRRQKWSIFLQSYFSEKFVLTGRFGPGAKLLNFFKNDRAYGMKGNVLIVSIL